MGMSRLSVLSLIGSFLCLGLLSAPSSAQVIGVNVNMVSGDQLPDGDPFLQRQNEPSIATSSRNPCHLLAGANDYRTVDLPGLPDDRVVGDAWQGIFKSDDCGSTWKSTLLPGFPQDTSNEGLASPLRGFEAAADPVVRSGTNGMFYSSGIVFDRTQNRGGVFVAPFIDLNNKENGDTIKYIDTVLIDTGNSGQFNDKSWLAVDVPRPGAGTCSITVPEDEPGGPTITQVFPAGNLYFVYAKFTGGSEDTKIQFTRSVDCGRNWSQPIKLSEGKVKVQGAVAGIDPRNGDIYVAWRQFSRLNDNIPAPDGINVVKSSDSGATFTKATVVATIASPADQPSLNADDHGVRGFRTNAFPTIAVDENGRVYLAWAERILPDERARILVSISTDGQSWTAPQVVEDPAAGHTAHQFMPALAYGAGKLSLLFYDFRDDFGADFPTDPVISFDPILGAPPPAFVHTLDVRVAQADRPGPGQPLNFAPSQRVSRYHFAIEPGPGPIEDRIVQLQANPPNFPLFSLGSQAFIGDYIDLAAAPAFVPDPADPTRWLFNTGDTAPMAPVFHGTWTDNRDVRPPADGDWSTYTPPNSDDTVIPCLPGREGMRNQNIYTASISEGLQVSAPGNTKPLVGPDGVPVQRAFVVEISNSTGEMKNYRLSFANQPPDFDPDAGLQASFLQFAFLPQLDLSIAAHSTAFRAAYITSGELLATVRVDVTEIEAAGGAVVPGGLSDSIILNPDILNPDILNPDILNPDILNTEIHNPDILNVDFTVSSIDNPDLLNPDLLNPDVLNPDLLNPDVLNPDLLNPDLLNPDILNPDVLNPDLLNPALSGGEELKWTAEVRNNGNTTSSYSINTLLATLPDDIGAVTQVLVYRLYDTPASSNCSLADETHQELVVNIVNPDLLNPDLLNPDVLNPDILNTTLALEPGDSALVTVRVLSPTPGMVEPIAPIFGVVAQAANTGETEPSAALVIITVVLDDAVRQKEYSATLQALGGAPPYTWSIVDGSLPDGLSLDSATGVISGKPTMLGTFTFTVEVIDSSLVQQDDSRELTLRVVKP